MTCSSPEEAELVRLALAPDNGSFLHAQVEGAGLRFFVPETALPTMVRTVDDLLAAMSAAFSAGRIS